jgi:hypothetical protein
MDILNEMKLAVSEVKVREDLTSYMHNAGDKVILLFQIQSLEQIEYISSVIPSLRTQILERLGAKSSQDIVNEKFPLPKCLWDLYVIGVYDASSLTLDPVRVSEIQRDHFAARKIIIEYTNIEELKNKIRKVIYPQYELDRLMLGVTRDSTALVRCLLEGVDLEVLNLENKASEQVSFDDIMSFVNEVSEEINSKAVD